MNLRQLINSPTRITDTTESLLDIILVSSPSLVRSSGVINAPISDHLPVFVELKVKPPKPTLHYISTRSFKNYDPNAFAFELAAKADDLLSIFNDSGIEVKLNNFNTVLQDTLSRHAPIKTIKLRNRPCPFVSCDIKKLMKIRDSLHRRFLLTRDTEDWEKFKEARNTVKRALTNAERDHTYHEVQQSKDNPKSLWKIINKAIPSRERERQVYTKDHKTVADEFNTFFSAVGKNAADAATKLAAENNIICGGFPSLPPFPDIELFNLKPVTCEVVKRIVLSMPSNKSPGPDKVKAELLKDVLPVILGPLTEIINCSLLTSTFPTAWKNAEVIPLLKDGDHEIPSNNRPLSLLPVASKVCERIVLEQFSTYLTAKKRLSSHQNGNKKFHSTETLNIYLTDQILKAMDNKKITALILLDLSKAFDSINHGRLLDKLSALGASPATVHWFRSYLSGRTQAVRIGSTVSDTLPITHGVPQGAILSPLLFCIYLNDLPGAPQECCLESYVDDSKLFLSFPLGDTNNAIRTLEEDLFRVATWCCQNHLLINPDKTKFVLLGTRQLMSRQSATPTLTFLGKTLSPVTSAKDLGVTLDSNLTYNAHISQLVSSCLAKLVQISRVKHSFDKKTLSLMINSLVFSKMFYCSSVWSNTSSCNIKKLQLIQNFASRIITGAAKFDHVTPVLHQLNWLSVKQQLYLRDAVLTYKCMKNLAPNYLSFNLQQRTTIHSRLTRNRNDLAIPLFRTVSGQRSFAYRSVKIWNSLDCSLKTSTSVAAFKRKLRDSLHSDATI